MMACNSITFPTDEFFAAMDSGRILWGDLMYVLPSLVQEALVWSDEDEALSNWDLPELDSLAAFEEHFPVSLLAIGGGNHALVWDEAKVAEWRNTRATSMDEHEEYEYYSSCRLNHALREYADLYTTAPGRDANEIAVIALRAVAPKKTKRAIDVLKVHPISWDRSGATHAIKPHGIKIAALGTSAEAVKTALLADLELCGDCVVETSTGGAYLCVVTITSMAVAEVVAAPKPVEVAAAPVKRALDVLKSLPISWDRDGNKHSIKVHGKKAEALGLSRNTVASTLLRNLVGVTDALVTVCGPADAYICIVTLL
jgi:hypothetical protein